MILVPKIIFVIFVACFVMFAPNAQAINAIRRPFISVRSQGMGGSLITTGLYEENWFGNPARTLANPKSKFTLLNLMPVDISTGILTKLKQMTGSTSNVVNNFMGFNLHGRAQLTLPAYFLNPEEDRPWALSTGMLYGLHLDTILSRNLRADSQILAEIEPVFNFAHPFLDGDLAIGINARYHSRIGSEFKYGFLDILEGNSLKAVNLLGQGSMINFDLGGTYKFLEWNNIKFELSAAISNIMGDQFSIHFPKILKVLGLPPSQATSFGFGLSLSLEDAPVLPFEDSLLALEFRDIGNNPQGGWGRLIHLGLETHLNVMAIRLGLNQGYWTAGLGLDLKYFTLELATYAEELSLNAGLRTDRRLALSLAFHIL